MCELDILARISYQVLLLLHVLSMQVGVLYNFSKVK